MEFLTPYNNAKLIYELYEYIDKMIINKILKNKYIKCINYTQTFFSVYDIQVNSLSKKYKNVLFPVLEMLQRDEIMLFEGKYVKVSMDEGFDKISELEMYLTPEEVWKKAILPELQRLSWYDKSYLDYDKE